MPAKIIISVLRQILAGDVIEIKKTPKGRKRLEELDRKRQNQKVLDNAKKEPPNTRFIVRDLGKIFPGMGDRPSYFSKDKSLYGKDITGTEKLADVGDYYLYKVNTFDGMKKLKQGTEWTIADKKYMFDRYYPDYYTEIHVYVSKHKDMHKNRDPLRKMVEFMTAKDEMFFFNAEDEQMKQNEFMRQVN